mgnify:CR=1 FL=1|jgi:hypothetical protein
MAERKPTAASAPKRPRLEELLRKARGTVLTEEDLREQQASFVFGNAPEGSKITKDSARESVGRILLRDPKPVS